MSYVLRMKKIRFHKILKGQGTNPWSAGLKSALTLLCIMSTTTTHFAYAAQGDTTLSQRGGYVLSRGDLSRDANHVAFMFSATHTYHGPSSILSTEFMHRFSVLFDTFYALGEDTLLFPITPLSQARIIEPSIHFDLCLFAKWRIRPCMGAGLSLVHLQSSVQNYQMYAGIPVEARFIYASAGNIFFYEIGARYRTLQNRIEGYIAKHSDLMPFFGLGIMIPGAP